MFDNLQERFRRNRDNESQASGGGIARAAKWGVGAAFLAAAGYGMHKLDYEIMPHVVPAQKFGVHIRMGQVKSDQLPSGLYWLRPVPDAYDEIYNLSNNTIIMGAQAGTGNNTEEQNPFRADFRLHYRINPKVGLLALHMEHFGDEDAAKEYLNNLMHHSVNAVVGHQHGRKTLAEPDAFLQAFTENFVWRLRQNNVPVDLDTVELLTMQVAGLRMPVQRRMKPGGQPESMAGAAAVSVPQAVSPAPK